MPFRFRRLSIPGLILIETTLYNDHRGQFYESYNEREFALHGVETRYVQDNFSHSHRSVLRGLHYQRPPMAQAKLVRCVAGAIYDVAVDLRPGSETYGRWEAVTLSAENGLQLYIPQGFAHGFTVLSESASVFYKVTEFYSPEHEAGIIWNDSQLAIEWPFSHPVLSEKDKRLPSLAQLGEVYEVKR